jgi:signal transduction histidine kinase
MATLSASSNTLSAPHIGFSAAESDSFGGVHNQLYAAVMAMVGHDLRQPLQVIMSERDVLARSLSSGAERVHLTRIARAVMQAADGLDRLIEAVRLHEASASDRRQSVSLRPILAGLASEFTEAAELKRIELRVVPTSITSSAPSPPSGNNAAAEAPLDP